MAEALSIVAACVALGKGCYGLYDLVQSIRDQHASIPVLRQEIKALKETVKKLEEDLQDESLFRAIQVTQDRHWPDVRQVLEDCKSTVEKLNSLLAKQGKSQNAIGRLAKVTKDITKTTWNYSKIEEYRKELRSFRTSLNLSLRVIMLYAPLLNSGSY